MIGTALACAAFSLVRISEFRVDSLPPLADVSFVELCGVAGEPLDGLTLLVVGDVAPAGSGWPDSGIVVASIPLNGTIPADRGYLVGSSPFLFENPDDASAVGMDSGHNWTLMLVSGTAPEAGTDLDELDDGIIDMPLEVVDSVSIVYQQPGPQGPAGCVYGSSAVGTGSGWVIWGAELCLDTFAWHLVPVAYPTGYDSPGALNPPCWATATCYGDLTGDGLIDSADLSELLSHWGDADGLCDFDRDGVVAGADLTVLLALWDSCDGPA